MTDKKKHYKRYCPRWQTKEGLAKKGKSYCAHDALSLALISGLCYEVLPTSATTNYKCINSQLSDWKFDHVEHFEATHSWDIDTQGFLATNNERTIIVFRGTDSKEDWRTNLQFSKEPGPFGDSFVHKGIQEAFFHVAFDIGQLIERHHTPEKELWLTGHSLGGALSIILAANLLKRQIHIDGIYTFAAPRIGDEAFSNTLNSTLKGLHVRVVNENDLVPYLPLEALFTHSGNIVLLAENGSNLTDVTPSMFNSLKQNIVQLFQSSSPEENSPVIDYHMLWTDKGYVKKLLLNLNQQITEKK